MSRTSVTASILVAGRAHDEGLPGPPTAPTEVKKGLAIAVHDEGAAGITVQPGRIQAGHGDIPVVAPHSITHTPDPLFFADLLLVAVVKLNRISYLHSRAKIGRNAMTLVPVKVHVAMRSLGRLSQIPQ